MRSRRYMGLAPPGKAAARRSRNGLIICGAVNFCWYVFKWALALSLVVALVAGFYLYQRVDDQIRIEIERKLAAHYSTLSVQLQSARLIEGEGIELRKLIISEPQANGPQTELARFDEVFLSCRTTLKELISGRQPEITQIRIRRPVLHATRRSDGRWSVARLLPCPKFSDNAPRVEVEDGSIEIFDPLRNPSSTLTVRDLHLDLEPLEGAAAAQGAFRVLGHLTADKVQRLELSGTLAANGSNWDLAGTVEAMELCPELHAALPGPLAEKLEALRAVRGEGSVRFRASKNEAEFAGIRFDCQGKIARGRIDHPRLPYPLTDLRARFRCDNHSITIEELTARNGRTTLRCSGQMRGYQANSPVSVRLSTQRLVLDSQFVDVMPAAMRDCWYEYLPEGEVDAEARLEFDGRVWHPEATVQCTNISFGCRKFPYRLERATGALTLRKERLDVRLMAYAGPEPVRLEGTILNPGPNFTGGIQVTADNIPFDEKLFAALPPTVGPVVRSLNPRGQFDVCMRVGRETADQKPQQYVSMSLNRCSLNYEKFPYPLENIRGSIELSGGQWHFRDLTGTNDTGTVLCHGDLTPTPRGPQLTLWFAGNNVPLEEELRDALPPHIGRIWDALKPRGTIDLPSITVNATPGNPRVSVALTARPRGESASIEPACFPYRLEKLRGSFQYRDGHVELVNVTGQHGRTAASGGGYCDVRSDGSWHLHLGKLNVDRIVADHELSAALPEGLRKAVAQLKPSGMINLRGDVDFYKTAGSRTLRSTWDTVLNVQQTDLDCGAKLQNVFGTVRLQGVCEGGRFQSRGEVALDSLVYRDLQYTSVYGPIWIDNERVLLGDWPETRSGQQPARRITARLLGGTVYGRGRVSLGKTSFYHLWAQLAEADLSLLTRENVAAGQRLNGKLLANLQLQGNTKGTASLDGGGSLHLRDADIYELPLMVALLKVLSVERPDTTAFTASDVFFRIKGEHILFDRITFSGSPISLDGQGEMNLDRQINLTLHATAGRGGWNVPGISAIIGEASQQIMQIRVDGTVDNPVTHHQAFPGVSQALEQLQATFQPQQQAPNQRPAGGSNSLRAQGPPPARAPEGQGTLSRFFQIR